MLIECLYFIVYFIYIFINILFNMVIKFIVLRASQYCYANVIRVFKSLDLNSISLILAGCLEQLASLNLSHQENTKSSGFLELNKITYVKCLEYGKCSKK
jgi:hypothetical protein